MAKYPILYPAVATDFFTMGQGPITTATKAVVIEERNGSFYAELTVIVDETIFPKIENNCFIKADVGHILKDQLFRIKRVVPTSKGTAEIYAEHVSYLSGELSLAPNVKVVSLTANSALALWKLNINEDNPFVVDSDIETRASTSWRIDEVENPRQALGGVKGSLLDVYGGEYRFDNYHISLMKKRGTTANTVLAYGRNITDFEQENNIANTYTSVYPYAKYENEHDQEIIVTLDEKTVHCSNLAAFPNPVVKSVDFSGEFEHDEIPTKAKLKKLAEDYVKANEYGVPMTSIKVSFLDLSKTADYAEYKALEQVDLCDDVRVFYPKLGVNTVAKVVRVVWNVLSESYDEIEIGQRRASLATIVNQQTQSIKEVEKNTGYALVAANGKNMVFYGLFGPDGKGEPKATLVGDMWFRPNGDVKDLLIWNGTIWEEILSNAVWKELEATIEENKKIVQDAKEAAERAEEAGKQAIALGKQTEEKVNKLDVVATDAKEAADKAVSKSLQNLELINATNLNLEAVRETVKGVSVSTDTALNNAQAALDKYNGLSFDNRQFLLGTANEMIFKGNGANNQTGITIPFSMGTLADCGFENGDRFTFKMAIKITGSGFAGEFRPQLSGNSWSSLIGAFLPVTKAETIEMEQTLTINSARMLDNGVNVRLNNVPSTVTFEILQCTTKFEKGTKATDWSYAPEDVQIELKSLGNELQAKVSQTSFDVLDKKVGTVQTLATQNEKAIKLKASQIDVDLISKDVQSLDAELIVQAGRVSTVTTKTDNNTKQIGLLETSYEGFKTLVLADYPTKESMATQIASSADKVTIDAQKWVNNKLTSYATIQVMNDSIGLAVADKVTNTQFSLLEGQVSTLITDRIPNLLVNSDWRNSFSGWSGTGVTSAKLLTLPTADKNIIGKTMSKYAQVDSEVLAAVGGDLYAIQTLKDPADCAGKKLRFSFWFKTLGGFSSPPLQATVRYTLNGVNQYVRFTNRSDNYLDVSLSWKRVDCLVDLTGIGAEDVLSDVRISFAVIASRVTATNHRVLLTGALATEDGNLYDWGYSYVISQSYSQILALRDQIDIRVKNDELIGAINTQAGRVLIRANDNVLMVTPETTYIANATIKTAAIADVAITRGKIANLAVGEGQIADAAITRAKIGTAAIVTAHIGDGVITTAKIGDAQIIGAKIKDASISSAKIINLDVGSLTGNLSSFVKTYWTDAFGSQVSITGSAITMVTTKASLALTANALRLYSSDYTGASAVFALGKWRDSSSTQTSATGIYIGSSSAISSNTDFTAFLNRSGASYMLYAESTMDYGANTNIVKNALNIFNTTHIWSGTTIHADFAVYGYMTFYGGDFSRITVDPNKATFNFRIKSGVTDGSYFWFNQKCVADGGFHSSSRLSLKNIDSEYRGDALAEICKTDIVEYAYKNSPEERQLSPIIDDIHKTSQYYLPDVIHDGKSINIYAMGSMAWLAIKQLNQKIEELERKLSA